MVEKSQLNYKAYKAGKETESLAYGSLSKDLTQLRKQEKWLSTIPSVPLQQCVRKWASSYWESTKSKKGRPRFKSSKRDNPTMEFVKSGFRLKDGVLCLPKKVCIPVVWSRELPSDPSSCVVHRDSVGDWFVSFVVRKPKESLPPNQEGVGVDWGVSTTATCSDGSELNASQLVKDNAKQLAKVQRKLSRSKKGSRGRSKRKKQVAKLHRKIRCQRKDIAHKWTRSIVNNFHYIAIEDFKPTFLQKTTMAKQAADNRIGELKQILISKAESCGRIVALVPPAYTTQTCNACGARTKHRLNERTFRCSSCGHTEGRDLNAAKTILAGAGFNPAAVDDVRRHSDFGSVLLSEAGIPVL